MACKHLNNSFLGLVTLKDNKNIYVYIYVQTIEKKKKHFDFVIYFKT